MRATYPRSDLIAGTKKLPPVANTPKKAYTIVPVRMAPMALRAGQRYARRCGRQERGHSAHHERPSSGRKAGKKRSLATLPLMVEPK